MHVSLQEEVRCQGQVFFFLSGSLSSSFPFFLFLKQDLSLHVEVTNMAK